MNAEEILVENLRLNQEVTQVEQGWEKTLNAIATGVLVQDARLHILRANQAAAAMIGEQACQLIGRTCYAIFHQASQPPPSCPFLDALRLKRAVVAEIEIPATGRLLEEVLEPLLSPEGEVFGMLHILRDLPKKNAARKSEKTHQDIIEANLNLQAAMKQLQNTQSQLVHSEKMAALGQLVSGVAHELNNPLAGVLGYAELLLAQNLNQQAKGGLERIYREAQRAAKIVQNLLSFARKYKPEKTLVQINDLLSNVLELRAYELTVNNILLDARLLPSLPFTMADGHQLQQCFFNIITNAEHALLAEGKGGTMTVVTSLVQHGPAFEMEKRASPRTSHKPQGHDTIRIEITNDGPSIPQEHLDHIFDPFFTTKPVGQGTGLGLSICYGILKEHGGSIAATSPLEGTERGTRFILELPVVKPEHSINDPPPA